MTEKSSKLSKTKTPRPRKKGAKKRVIQPLSDLGIALAGALILIRDRLDREECHCDTPDAAGWCPICAISAAAPFAAAVQSEAEAALANVAEDEDFTPAESIEVRSALIHWIEGASDEEVEETFVAAIDIAEAV